MITPTQSRMARAALGWSLRDLAVKSKVAVAAINRFEVGHREANQSTRALLRLSFEAAGVRFLEDGSVRPPLEAASS